jgi:integrase
VRIFQIAADLPLRISAKKRKGYTITNVRSVRVLLLRLPQKDLFCFMCFTGMRVSDLRNLKKENIKAGQIFKTIVKPHKTEVIPLNQFAQAIPAKYEHLEITPLPKLSSQKLNDISKTAAKKQRLIPGFTMWTIPAARHGSIQSQNGN